MPGYYEHVNVLPGSIELERDTQTLADGAAWFGRWASIVDIVSDPSNPLADFGDSAQIMYVKNTAIAWGVAIVDTGEAWAGTNRAGFVVEVLTNVLGVVPPTFRGDVVARTRLWIGRNFHGTTRYQFSGIVPVNALMAGIRFRNHTGDDVTFSYSLVAVPWSNN